MGRPVDFNNPNRGRPRSPKPRPFDTAEPRKGDALYALERPTLPAKRCTCGKLVPARDDFCGFCGRGEVRRG